MAVVDAKGKMDSPLNPSSLFPPSPHTQTSHSRDGGRMKHVILFHKDCTKFLIKHGVDANATWLPHSVPSQLPLGGR